MQLLQVTLGAAATPLASAATSTLGLYCSALVIQNNSASVMRIGDSTVSATRGILLAAGTPGGSSTFQIPLERGTLLEQWFVFGTAATVVDVLLETAN